MAEGSGRFGAHSSAIYRPSLPRKHYSSSSLSSWYALKVILCLIHHPPSGPSLLESLCTTYSLVCSALMNSYNIHSTNTPRAPMMVGMSRRSSTRCNRAGLLSKNMQHWHYPSSPLSSLPPSFYINESIPFPAIISRSLSWLPSPLPPFLRERSSSYTALYMIQSSVTTLGAVPAMLDRLLLIHTLNNVVNNQLYLFTTSYGSFVALVAFSEFFDLFDFSSHQITCGQAFPKRL